MTEAAAAKEAGLSAIIVVRDGNAALTDEEKLAYTTVESFLDLTFQASTKRQKLETVDEKIDECTTNVCEPMDTSEDVDTPARDIGQSSPRVEENVTKEAIESEGKKECADGGQSSKDVSSSLAQKEEPIAVEKDLSTKVEEQILISEVAEINGANAKSTKETNKNPESVEQTTKDDDATMPIAKDSDKIAVPEKTKENCDTVAIEITPTTADDSINVSVAESASKSENSAAASSEKKTEDSTKDMQIDVADNVETIASDKEANEHETQTCEKGMADVPEESLKMGKDEVKEESKIVPDTSESENVSTKSEPEEVAKLQTSAADPAENGETVVGTAGSEKSPIIITEMETAANTADVKEDATSPIKVSTEKSSDMNEQIEKTDEKTAEETKAGETISADAEERDNESTKQETAKEKGTVKEENVMDTKDKNTVDSEKQKLNGTTQNGDTDDVPVLDDKLHSNGLNEGSSKETTAEDTAAQNGEPESSSENSAESIKVKKVVDSTVADGAGEPDVVPPVVVAATS